MRFAKETSGVKRYLAIDIDKEYALVGGQNAQQKRVLPPRRVGIKKFREWVAANLCAGDAVVLETTTNVWYTSANQVTFDISRMRLIGCVEMSTIATCQQKFPIRAPCVFRQS